MKLSFSTLACPNWSSEQVIRAASSYGYDGVEWRLLDGAVLDSKLPLSRAERLGDEVRGAGLQVCALDTGVRDVHLIAAPGPDQDAVVSETRAMLKLAGAMGAEHLRVFPGDPPEGVTETQAVGWAIATTSALLEDIEAAGVNLALELHNPMSAAGPERRTSSLVAREIVDSFPDARVGIQWDWGNTYLEAEPAEVTWERVRPRLLYCHTKDMAPSEDGSSSYVPIGSGALAIEKILGWLSEAGFDGWLSYEWEKKWHPELAEPEEALPQYVEFMRAQLG